MSLHTTLQPLADELAAMLRAVADPGGTLDQEAEARRLWQAAQRWEATAPSELAGVAVRLTLCCLNAVSDPASARSLEELASHLETADRTNLWTGARSYLLIGAPISFKASEAPVGSSMMSWQTFQEHYADSYAKPPASPSDRAALWQSIVNGEIAVPQEDLTFDSRRGIVWFTDQDALHRATKPSGGRVDGTAAYDALALDWALKNGVPQKAVILHCHLTERSQAMKGLRRPTAVDAWGNWLFSPGDPDGSDEWPEVASRPRVPRTGRTLLPEGIHGPLTLIAGSDVPVEACSRVTKTVGDRVSECSSQVARRILKRWS